VVWGLDKIFWGGEFWVLWRLGSGFGVLVVRTGGLCEENGVFVASLWWIDGV
jgi:hypothetical protein